MKVGKPDPEISPPQPPRSLAERLGEAMRQPRDAAIEGWPPLRLAAVLALLIAAAPLLTIAGATLLASREKAAAARLEGDLAPLIASAQGAEEARRALRQLLARRAPAPLLEALGKTLPPEARLVRIERTAQGALEFDVAAPDPDTLRLALRRAPAFAQLRNVGQRQDEGGGMIVSFLGGAE